MLYEFIFFEEHFHILLTKTSFPKNYLTDSKKNLDREYLRLIRAFRDLAVQGKKRKKIKTYFNFHQKNLIILMDKVYTEINQEKPSSNRKMANESMRFLLIKMGSFLDWMQKMFPGYFNLNEKAPLSFLTVEAEKISKASNELDSELKKRKFSNQFQEMTRVITDSKYLNSFRDIGYWRALVNITLIKIIEEDLNDEFGIMRIFVENGVNHSEFYKYARNYISLEVEKRPTLDEQISTMCGYRKDIRLLFIQTNHKQFLDFPDIKNVLKKFIREELLLLRAMEFVNQGLAEAGVMNANYKVSFSVKQLAFFVHLQMETGIIIWQRAKFAHQYIARHFSTVERESISEKSVRNAHYNHAGEDIKKVIAKLGEMLALAQEKY